MPEHLEGDLYLPDRENFSMLPKEVLSLFSEDRGPKRVVFFLIDAFGWAQYQRLSALENSVKELFELGKLRKLTSQFPSTTTAHVTTLLFNQPVGVHGRYEWQIYEPLVDSIFITLPYALIKGKILPKAEEILPARNIFEMLSSLGVHSTVVSPKEYLRSPYNSIAVRGTKYQGYSRATWHVVLREAVEALPERSFLYFYYPYLDEEGHIHGPESPQVTREAVAICSELTSLIAENALDDWFLTADHGMVAVNPAETIRLDLEFPQIMKIIKRTGSGDYISPVGSERDLFLHTTSPTELKALISDALAGRAAVYLTSELIERGAFGGSISEHFLDRVGDVVVLPHEGYSVWMLEGLTKRGQHGGLTLKEIEIPLLRRARGRGA